MIFGEISTHETGMGEFDDGLVREWNGMGVFYRKGMGWVVIFYKCFTSHTE